MAVKDERPPFKGFVGRYPGRAKKYYVPANVRSRFTARGRGRIIRQATDRENEDANLLACRYRWIPLGRLRVQAEVKRHQIKVSLERARKPPPPPTEPEKSEKPQKKEPKATEPEKSEKPQKKEPKAKSGSMADRIRRATGGETK